MVDSRAEATLGVISFLNTRPLIGSLEGRPGIRLTYAVPSGLPAMLADGSVDAALVPVIEVARAGTAWHVISDACIAADGETLTVRVFSRVPPEKIRTLHTDTDSRTSVALAQLLWSRFYRHTVTFRPLERPGDRDSCEAILLIGDKVVTAAPQDFAHQCDLGSAWKQWTGLPFVFAVWAARPSADPALGELLSAARDHGVANAAEIAREHGPARGWPVELAEAYLTRYMKYTLTDEARRGMSLFLEMAAEAGLATPASTVAIP